MIAFVLAFAAFVTSIVSGILGMAGGVALIGLMTAILPPAQVVPMHGMVQLFSNGSRTLIMLRDVVWREALFCIAPMLLGVSVATYFGRGVQFQWLQPTIGAMLVAFVIWRRFLSSRIAHHVPLYAYSLVGLAVGLVTLFIGATGPMVAPVMRRDDWSPKQTVATMAVVQSVGHLLKLPAFLVIGFDYTPHLPLLAVLLVCSFAGTWVGRKALDAISKDRFALVFDVTLTVLAVFLIAR